MLLSVVEYFGVSAEWIVHLRRLFFKLLPNSSHTLLDRPRILFILQLLNVDPMGFHPHFRPETLVDFRQDV